MGGILLGYKQPPADVSSYASGNKKISVVSQALYWAKELAPAFVTIAVLGFFFGLFAGLARAGYELVIRTLL